MGISKKTAAEFSFLLAIPTMIAATGYDSLKHIHDFSVSQWQPIAIGFVAAFVVAMLVVQAFMKYLARYTFIPFGIYRIVIAIVFLLYV